jgi:hypothetical protein
VRRWFLYRLRGGNQDGKESEKAEEFHVVWCVEKADAEGHQKASANAIELSSHAVSHADRVAPALHLLRERQEVGGQTSVKLRVTNHKKSPKDRNE